MVYFFNVGVGRLALVPRVRRISATRQPVYNQDGWHGSAWERTNTNTKTTASEGDGWLGGAREVPGSYFRYRRANISRAHTSRLMAFNVAFKDPSRRASLI